MSKLTTKIKAAVRGEQVSDDIFVATDNTGVK